MKSYTCDGCGRSGSHPFPGWLHIETLDRRRGILRVPLHFCTWVCLAARANAEMLAEVA